MPIDDCRYSFFELATVQLPAHMNRMNDACRHPIPMEVFASGGVKKCLECLEDELRKDRDFSGCYVLIEDKPIYVGISRKVISRLTQHVKGKSHFDASLAYRIACHHCKHEISRQEAMNDAKFMREFNRAKESLRKMSAAVIRIDCPVELYGFELYCSLELDTGQWHTFRTH